MKLLTLGICMKRREMRLSLAEGNQMRFHACRIIRCTWTVRGDESNQCHVANHPYRNHDLS